MHRNGQIMHKNAHGMRRTYKAGCRCDLCKQAESAYKRELRQRQREAVGDFVTQVVPSLSLMVGGALTSGNDPAKYLGAVESAVALEIEALGRHHRPGIATWSMAFPRWKAM
jgi:hypothetical protein